MIDMGKAMSTKEGQSLMKEAVSEVAKGVPFSMKTKDNLIVVAAESSNKMGAVAFGGERDMFGSSALEITENIKSLMDMGIGIIDATMEDIKKELENELIRDTLESHYNYIKGDNNNNNNHNYYDDDEVCPECGEYYCMCEDDFDHEDEDYNDDEVCPECGEYYCMCDYEEEEEEEDEDEDEDDEDENARILQKKIMEILEHISGGSIDNNALSRIFIRHRGVNIFHVYKNYDYEEDLLLYWYSLDNQGIEVFDIRNLSNYSKEKKHEEIIREAINLGILSLDK